MKKIRKELKSRSRQMNQREKLQIKMGNWLKKIRS